MKSSFPKFTFVSPSYLVTQGLMKTKIIIVGLLFLASHLYGQKTIKDYKVIEDAANQYKSIDDILQLPDLKGKVVYVDIWGTSCVPCIEEFKYLPELKAQFKGQEVVYLYLSSPYTLEWSPQNATKSKALIVKHNLEGLNVLISAECYDQGFYQKYKDKIPPKLMYSIPMYLLVDKQGNIVKFNAPRPSSKEILYAEIQKLLEMN